MRVEDTGLFCGAMRELDQDELLAFEQLWGEDPYEDYEDPNNHGGWL